MLARRTLLVSGAAALLAATRRLVWGQAPDVVGGCGLPGTLWKPELASLDWLARLGLPVKGAIATKQVSWLEAGKVYHIGTLGA